MPGYRAVTLLIEEDTMRQFKKTCVLRERTIKEVVNSMMKQFVEESMEDAQKTG